MSASSRLSLMVGVGAAFDLLSGNLSEAPDWMKRNGLQWLYRLIKEPRRLWRRYLLNNPRFVWLVLVAAAWPEKIPGCSGRSSRTVERL